MMGVQDTVYQSCAEKPSCHPVLPQYNEDICKQGDPIKPPKAKDNVHVGHVFQFSSRFSSVGEEIMSGIQACNPTSENFLSKDLLKNYCLFQSPAARVRLPSNWCVYALILAPGTRNQSHKI